MKVRNSVCSLEGLKYNDANISDVSYIDFASGGGFEYFLFDIPKKVSVINEYAL